MLQALQRPATSVISAFLVFVWFLLNQYRLGYPEAGMRYAACGTGCAAAALASEVRLS